MLRHAHAMHAPHAPVALTIAGSDSSGGAGVQADLRTFAALEVYGASAITAVTSQNTSGVRGVVALEPAFVQSQIDAVLDDLPVGAIKTGMLGTAALVGAVVVELTKCNVPVVVDPVMVAKSGHALLADDAVAAVRTQLLPRAALVTPNLPEASALCGFPVRTVAEQESAARMLVGELGARAALVKGGHTTGDPVDVLWDGARMTRLEAPRVDTRHTHGTGCTYSAAVAALLARGLSLVDAVTRAHAYVHEAIVQAPGLGRGHGPLHHMHPWYRFPS
jgi:hydroxymethylpyrimidine/phosphomethylpyrimidine kinase